MFGCIRTICTQLAIALLAPALLAQTQLPEVPEYNLPEQQDAPGVSYQSTSQQLPNYFYTQRYFDQTDGDGARPIADYGPPGYTHRDYQDAPGEPEWTRLTPPVRVSAQERDQLDVRGLYPGSFLAPGTNTSFRLRGFVRLASLYDFDPIGSTDSFVPNTIPVPQQDGQNYNMSGRISRFALESWTPTSYRDWNVHTFIEGDFFNGPAQAAGGGGNPFRLRHAFFDFGYFRFGQQNSVFMDGSNWPSLVDFQGPNSWVNQRQPSMRVTLPVRERIFWAASVERCFSDITTNGLGTNVQEVPDLATHLRFEADRGHIQVAGLMRTIGYRPTGGDVTQQTGAGISGNVVFHPWAILSGCDPVHEVNPSGLTRSRILLQGTWGSGISRYINDLAGQGFDAQVNPITGEFELVDATGWNASYEHWFNEHWLMNFTYANVNVDNNANQPATTYDAAEYVAASLWWIPVPRLSFGVEYITGERENLDGESARAQRLHGLAQYNF
ncbi:DcaP family trimeric outer membrane transporter [Bythopirellula polymerisocia]|uniref:Porin subfamily protein n=1 Tax=Bythopirellula polymerisocia TaxID=2528003 RepID=A0A5C6D3D4_9BACT|nr:DcaP family trimeric outer membrane transporter [Bythopirellula polymerisocia]TWU29736.1 Porin subfamily protein [Bythopirellula polymerisocia]